MNDRDGVQDHDEIGNTWFWDLEDVIIHGYNSLLMLRSTWEIKISFIGGVRQVSM